MIIKYSKILKSFSSAEFPNADNFFANYVLKQDWLNYLLINNIIKKLRNFDTIINYLKNVINFSSKDSGFVFSRIMLINV